MAAALEKAKEKMLSLLLAVCGSTAALQKAKEKMLLLRSSDNQEFEVNESVAMQSTMLRKMIEDSCADKVIALPNVTSHVLDKVIEYCNKHAEPTGRPGDAESAEDGLNIFDADFILDVELDTLIDIMLRKNSSQNTVQQQNSENSVPEFSGHLNDDELEALNQAQLDANQNDEFFLGPDHQAEHVAQQFELNGLNLNEAQDAESQAHFELGPNIVSQASGNGTAVLQQIGQQAQMQEVPQGSPGHLNLVQQNDPEDDYDYWPTLRRVSGSDSDSSDPRHRLDHPGGSYVPSIDSERTVSDLGSDGNNLQIAHAKSVQLAWGGSTQQIDFSHPPVSSAGMDQGNSSDAPHVQQDIVIGQAGEALQAQIPQPAQGLTAGMFQNVSQIHLNSQQSAMFMGFSQADGRLPEEAEFIQSILDQRQNQAQHFQAQEMGPVTLSALGQRIVGHQEDQVISLEAQHDAAAVASTIQAYFPTAPDKIAFNGGEGCSKEPPSRKRRALAISEAEVRRSSRLTEKKKEGGAGRKTEEKNPQGRPNTRSRSTK